MARLVLLAAAALVLVPGAAVGKVNVAPFGANVNVFGWQVDSNADWKVGGDPVKTVRPWAGGLASERESMIWSATCTPGAQTIAFTRVVQLPGQPKDATFTLSERAPGLTGSTNPFRSVELQVNGVTALPKAQQSGEQTKSELGPAALSLFKYGANTLRVIVARGTLPAKVTKCNTGSIFDEVGIAFSLEASSSADLSITPGKAKARTVRLPAGSSGSILNGNLVATNAGPSAALGGDFTFLLNVGTSYLSGLLAPPTVTAGPPFQKCSTQQTGFGLVAIRCSFDVFPPGQSATIKIVAVADGRKFRTVDTDTVDARWEFYSRPPQGVQGYGTKDPDLTNNHWEETIVYCGAQAISAACSKAEGGKGP